jgi:hypothetical protein
MGRRAHQPDAFHQRQVEAMAGYGVPEADIAKVLKIDPKTLRRHYREQLDTGHIKANSRIAESLYRKAMGDGPQSVTAAIFWLKTRAGWKETSIQQTTGEVRHTFVARLPPPVKDLDEWMRLYAPPEQVSRPTIDLSRVAPSGKP